MDQMILESAMKNLNFHDSPRAFPKEKFDEMVHRLFESIAENGQGCGAAYVAASQGKLFGGLNFPTTVLIAYWDFLNDFTVTSLFQLIRVCIDYGREVIGILGDHGHEIFADPWKGDALLEHCKTLGLTMADIQKTPEILSKRYKELAITTHPDKGGSNEEFVKVKESYEVLKLVFLGDQPSGQTTFVLSAMKDVLKFIDEHENDINHARIMTRLVHFVHHEHVERNIQSLDDQSKFSIDRERRSMAIDLRVKIGVLLFDTLLVPPENLCDFSYTHAKAFYQEARETTFRETYPGIGLTLLCDEGFLSHCVSNEARRTISSTSSDSDASASVQYDFETKYESMEDALARVVCRRLSAATEEEDVGNSAEAAEVAEVAEAAEAAEAAEVAKETWESSISHCLEKKNPLPNILGRLNPITSYLPIIDIVWNDEIRCVFIFFCYFLFPTEFQKVVGWWWWWLTLFLFSLSSPVLLHECWD